jgi:peptidoglycan/LPS O-acetylase OafA/YrhL
MKLERQVMSTPYSRLENQHVSLSRRWADYSQKVTASLEIKKPKGHLLVLDGVRAVACLAVLLHHIVYHVVLPERWSGVWTPSGKMQMILAALLNFGASGVILFFLLSSFLLFLPFARVLLFDGPWPSISRFYIRRFFRILPGYYAAIILMVLFFHPEFLHAENRWKLLQFFTFSMQAQLPEQLNGPFWTMSVEFAY